MFQEKKNKKRKKQNNRKVNPFHLESREKKERGTYDEGLVL